MKIASALLVSYYWLVVSPATVAAVKGIPSEGSSLESRALASPQANDKICGQEVSSVDDFLLNPPAIFQEMLDVGFGVSYGWGPIYDPDLEDDDSKQPQSDACTSLGQVMGGHNYFFLDVDEVDRSSSEFFIEGPEADGKIDERYESSQKGQIASNGSQKKQSASKGSSRKGQRVSNDRKSQNIQSSPLSDHLPICMAMRPCAVNNTKETYGIEATFGAYIESGICMDISANPPAEFCLYGLAVSTAGDLTPFNFSCPLIDNYAPEGMHAWINAGVGVPLDKFGTLEFRGQFGIYGMINNDPHIGTLIDSMFDAEGLDPIAMSSFLDDFDSARLQIFADVKLLVTLDLEVLMGIPGGTFGPIELPGFSTMLDFQYKKNQPSDTWVDVRFSKKSSSDDMVETVRTALEKKVGQFGVDLLQMVTNGIGMESEQKLKLRLNGDRTIDFALEMRFTVKMFCGGLATIVEGIMRAISFLTLNDSTGLVDAIFGPIKDILDAICGNQIGLGISIHFIDGSLDQERTCFIAIAGVKEYTICMDKFPTCPPPVAPYGKCSLNTDCNSDMYPNGGYCLNHERWNVAIGCLGTCIHKLQNGESCSKSDANLFPVQRLDFSDAEDELCISGSCICGTCANTNHKVSLGKACATNDNCESGYCMGWSTTMCLGKCELKQPDFADCSPTAARDLQGFSPLSAADEFCQSNSCICSQCSPGTGLLSGHKCATDANCAGGHCSKAFAGVGLGCSGFCGRWQYRFEIDIRNRNQLRDQGGTRSIVRIEFYYTNGIVGCVKELHNGISQGDTWHSYEDCYGDAREPEYVAVKVLGDDALGIDVANFYSKLAHHSRWDRRARYGVQNGGSYWISRNSNYIPNISIYPCLKFMVQSEDVYNCGKIGNINGLQEQVIYGNY